MSATSKRDLDALRAEFLRLLTEDTDSPDSSVGVFDADFGWPVWDVQDQLALVMAKFDQAIEAASA